MSAGSGDTGCRIKCCTLYFSCLPVFAGGMATVFPAVPGGPVTRLSASKALAFIQDTNASAPARSRACPAPGDSRQHLDAEPAGGMRGSCDRTASAAGYSVFILLGRARRAAEGRDECRVPPSRPFPPFALFQANHLNRQRLRRLTRRTGRPRRCDLPTAFFRVLRDSRT